MRVNFLEGFSRWLQEQAPPLLAEESEKGEEQGQDFDTWLKQNMNFGLKNFAQLGDLQLTNTKFRTIDGEEIPIVGMVKFRVRPLDEEGKVYELEDAGEGDLDDPTVPKEPYGRSSPHAGKKYKVTEREFQRIWLFPHQPQMGAPSGGPPLGMK